MRAFLKPLDLLSQQKNFNLFGLVCWVSIIKLKLFLALVIGEESVGFRVLGFRVKGVRLRVVPEFFPIFFWMGREGGAVVCL